MKLVTVFSAFNPAEAQVIRGRLEAAGFHVVLTNELNAMMLPLYSTVGAILVQVPEDEAEDAKTLLAAGETPPESPQPPT